VADRRGLSALLSQVLVAYTIEYDNAFERHMPHRTTAFGIGGPPPRLSTNGTPMRRPWLVSMAMWSNFMRYLPKEGTAPGGVEDLNGNLGGLQRWGYVTVDSETRVIRPTRAGRMAQAIWSRLDEVVDSRWTKRFGTPANADLRESLGGIVARLPQDLPRYLPIVTPGNGLRTKQPQFALAHTPPAGPGSLDLPALLSRLLLAFTLEYETASELSLPIGANVLRVLDTQGVPQRDLPVTTGVSKEAVSAAVSYLQRHGYAALDADSNGRRGRVVKLTDAGHQARAHDAKVLAAVEDRWESRYGDAHLQRLRALLEALFEERDGESPMITLSLQPHPENWRAHRPYATRTEAFLRDPAEALPRHPMVLHRGGFPDGA
jgi:DNA-binding MarR family transcriptional regulator